MKTLAGVLGLAAIVLPVAAYADEFGDIDHEEQGPAIRLGFQMALRTGFALPLGKATGEDSGEMSNLTKAQVPLIVELGGKVVPNLFLGGYLSFSGGPATGDSDDLCDQGNNDCYVTGLRAGLEGHFQLAPHGTANPWIGYGFGYESLTLSLKGGDDEGSSSLTGPEYARVMAGLDLRLGRTFGFGPFLDVSIGKFTRFDEDLPASKEDGDIPKTAMHEWVTVGARFVFFP
jgi:hypothetical protein